MTSLLEPSPTTSRSGVRIGAQQPRVHRAPPYTKTYGDEVNDFMRQLGRPGDPWQELFVRDAHAVRPDGLWSLFELLLLLSRQNGKGWGTDAIELGGLFLFREPLILHSSHQFKTSTSTFRRLIDVIDSSDWLTKRVKNVSRSKGDEGIYLTRAAGGGALQFVARSLGSGRGLTGSKNIFDEAWALTIGQYAAQTPTLSTIPNPQIIYTTTPPDEDLGPPPHDAMLPSVRRRAVSGDDRTGVHEYSPEPGFDRTDRDVWYRCNPALGIRISEWFLAKQLAAFTEAGKPQKFDTEHLGVWPLDEAAQWLTIAKADWDAAADVAPAPTGRMAFGIEVNWDREWAAIGVAWRRADNRRQVEITQGDSGVDHRPGTAWCLDRARELLKRWPGSVLVIPDGPAGSLHKDFEDAGVPFVAMKGMDQTKGFGDLYDSIAGPDVEKRDVRHGNQPALNNAAAGAIARPVGDAKAWDRKASINHAPLGAATGALWGLRNLTIPRSRVF